MTDYAKHWRHHLDRFTPFLTAQRPSLLSDFDGTLSFFHKIANLAVITPENATALDRLLAQLPLVALLSGRAADDLRQRFDRQGMRYYGSHGLDYINEAGDLELIDEARAWVAPLRELIAQLVLPSESGIFAENKGATASIHYRNATDPVMAQTMLYDQLKPLCETYGFQLSEGRQIWEIKPPLAINKGTSLQTLITTHNSDAALFLGDDYTDLTAMHRLRDISSHGKVIGVNVGVVYPEGTPPDVIAFADVIATSPDDVAALLHWIADQL